MIFFDVSVFQKVNVLVGQMKHFVIRSGQKSSAPVIYKQLLLSLRHNYFFNEKKEKRSNEEC